MAKQDDAKLPVAISCIQDRYMLFDIQAVTWLRKAHNICGIFLGSLPQNPSQSVFMGLPMEIMPEEAQYLVEIGVGQLVDDVKAHDVAMAAAKRQNQTQYIQQLQQHASELERDYAREKEALRQKAFKKAMSQKKKVDDKAVVVKSDEAESVDASESLFDVEEVTRTNSVSTIVPERIVTITPTTSSILLSSQPSAAVQKLLPGVTRSSYNLCKHLHSIPNKTYFMTPGLRFGCQFCVYPGDPLRFHSHFLAVGVDWNEEIDLMNLVGGGRLGTGVKKGYLFGGSDPLKEEMRTFSLEWAAM